MNLLINQQKSFLFFLFIFSFLVRFFLFNFYLSKNQNYFTADSGGYHDVAVQIAQGNGISNSNGSSNFFRLPGYPVFLALFYKIFNQDFYKTILFQILFASFIPVLIFILSFIVFPQNLLLAKILAFYGSIHVGFTVFSGLLMSETLFCLFFLLFLILFLKKYYIYSGLFLGLATLVRPVGHYILFLSLIFIFFSQFKFKTKIKNFLFLSFSWFFIIFIWILRNYFLTGFLFFHTLPGKHFLNHTASYIVMKNENLSYEQAKFKLTEKFLDQVEQKELLLNRKTSDIERCLIAEKISYEYIKEYPVLFIKHSFINISKTIFAPFSQEFAFIEEKNGKAQSFWGFDITNKFFKIIWFLENIIIFFVYLGFFLFCLIILFKFLILRQINLSQLFCLSLIFLFIFITLASGFARLRLPIEPLILILSGNFWINYFRSKRFENI